MKLNVKGIEKLIKDVQSSGQPKKAADGGGLYIEVTPSGGKYWRMKYRFNGKENRLSFGVFPDISLQDAREKRRVAKKLLDEGIDPSEKKKADKREQIANSENSFENVAREWHKHSQHMWKPIHAERMMIRLEKDILPIIGERPIKDIHLSELLKVARKVEERGANDLAHRVMQMCGQVFRYAVVTGRAERDITPELKGALKPVKREHMKHIDAKQLPDFMKKLNKYEKYGGHTLTKLAFQFLIHTFVRSGEIRGAKWDEIDFDKQEWRIPAERMKMKEQHIIHLPKQSIEILKKIHTITGESYGNMVFPSQQNPRKIMSENTFLRVIEVLGYKGKATAHGFRSTASTILNENGFYPDVIERQLAHCERNQIRAAYNHAQYLPERRKMMDWWADYLEEASNE